MVPQIGGVARVVQITHRPTRPKICKIDDFARLKTIYGTFERPLPLNRLKTRRSSAPEDKKWGVDPKPSDHSTKTGTFPFGGWTRSVPAIKNWDLSPSKHNPSSSTSCKRGHKLGPYSLGLPYLRKCQCGFQAAWNIYRGLIRGKTTKTGAIASSERFKTRTSTSSTSHLNIYWDLDIPDREQA